MTTTALEREQKYEAPPGVRLPSLDDLPGAAAQAEPATDTDTLTAEYYDTVDLRLLKAGITLRRREGGRDQGWHLKLPDGAARREIRVPLDRPGDPVPDELTHLIRVHTRTVALHPVARIQTRRRTTTLRDPAGTSLAKVVSDEVAAQTLGSSTTVSQWNEIEVELTGGNADLLRAVHKRLRHSGLRSASYHAKLERALGAEPGRSRPRLTLRSTAGQVVLAYLDAQAARLKAFDPAVRRDQPDSIHQLRVTTRRLRSTLQAFGSILHQPSSAHLRAELKWLAGVLGEAREAEVLSEHLRSALSDLPAELVIGPAQARVRLHFAPREADARAAVLSALDSDRYFALLDELDEFILDPPFTRKAARPARDALAADLRQARKRARRRISRAERARTGPDRDAALHEVRKAAKRARYAGEAAGPVLGKRTRRFAKNMKSVQSVLGDQHDAVNMRAVARELGVHAHLAGENAFSFGLLHERAHRDADEYRRAGRQAWQRAVGGKLI